MRPHSRVLLFAVIVAAATLASAQQPDFSVRVTSPVDGGLISGPVRLVAVIEPPASTPSA